MNFVEVATTDELMDGNMKMATVSGRDILLARVGYNYYSTDNSCPPHMGSNLSMCTLEGTVVTCPRHHSQFDLTDGHVTYVQTGSGLDFP